MSTGPFVSDPLLDARLGTYRVIRSLGMGGMGKVYVAQDETLKRPVALKVIHEQYRARQDYRARMMSEATAIANLKHPNIVQIYAAGEQDGILYFAMELVSGRNLKDILSENLVDGLPVNFDGILQVGTAIAAALDFAHSKGLLHGDVKPANVLITSDNHVYLTDFGLALDFREPAEAEFLDDGGTPQYMAPERIDHTYPTGPASDQYSLGVMLFEMFTGTVPFDGDDPEAIYQKHLNNPPPKPRSLNRYLTPEIQDVLLHALAKHPADRFENCTMLMRRLAQALDAAQDAPAPQRIALPALPAGTRARHGLPLTKPDPSPERKPRANPTTAPIPDVRVTENTRPRTSPPPAAPKKLPRRRDDRLFWLGAGALGMVVIFLVLFFGYQFFASAKMLGFRPTAAATREVASTSTPRSSATLTFPVIAPPVGTPTPVSTPDVTPALTLPAPSPSPTEVTGDPFVLIYDDHSFNLLNLSTRSRNISLLAFERLDFSGTPSESFSGQQWARFNAVIRPETCMRIKISNGAFLTPPEVCNNIFDAEITISLNNEADFWTIRTDSSQFRVLWAGAEIKRCATILRRCEILIP